MEKKKRKRKLSPEQVLERRTKRQFRNKIRNIFSVAGFEYINTEDKHIKIGHRMVEVDFVFIYKNIVLICEDTTTQTKNIVDHIRNKQEAFVEINANFSEYFDWLTNTFPEKMDLLKSYSVARYKIFYLYFSLDKIGLDDDRRKLYSNITFVEPTSLNYFDRMAKCIKKSVRFELFRFLNLENKDIGDATSQRTNAKIEATIIYPEGVTGLRTGVRVVSFMMSAASLLETSYVLRKDNWENSIWLYQRLIEPPKIKSIRAFLADKGVAFYNNVIVALPDNVSFYDTDEHQISIEQLDTFKPCKMIITKEMNSICVIDGQHRIYAHYEGTDQDKYEKKIALLRNKLHLLVTGLIFPPDMDALKRSQIQSEIFLEINTNAKSVPPDVILHIERLQDPFSDIGIARQVIEQLNKGELFHDRFEMSTLDKGKIKIASIIKWALKNLVTVHPSENRASIYKFWEGDKSKIDDKDTESLIEYIQFIANTLNEYFGAVKKNNKNAWNDPSSKLLSVTSINGFIIAFTRQLSKNGIKDFDFYDSSLRKFKYDYTKERFGYTSSQYRMFSNEIIEGAFGLDSNEY